MRNGSRIGCYLGAVSRKDVNDVMMTSVRRRASIRRWIHPEV